MMIFRFSILASVSIGTLAARAGILEGTVRESRYGMGADSVRVSWKGGAAAAYTDSAGRFSLDRGIVPVLRTGREKAGPKRSGRVRAPEWERGGPRGSVAIRDSKGKQIRMASLPSAALAKRASGGADDTLVLEKKGFATLLMPVPAGAGTVEVRLAREPIKVLIIDGMSNHDWAQTTKVVRAIYAMSGFFSVTVSTAPPVSDTAALQWWRPNPAAYEMVLMNYNSGHTNGKRWPRERELELEAYVAGGGGLYVLHSANNSFPAWPEYDKMIALGFRASAHFGPAVEIDKRGALVRIPAGVGLATGHGNRLNTLVTLLTSHPVNKGFPRQYLVSNLEVYYYARGAAQNFTVLSYAFDGPAAGNTNKNWPIELLAGYGRGLVYNATAGHLWPGETVPDAYRDVSFQTNLIRASEWLARREVFYPLPGEFNTAAKVVYRDIPMP